MPYASMAQIFRGMPRRKFEQLATEIWSEFIKIHKE